MEGKEQPASAGRARFKFVVFTLEGAQHERCTRWAARNGNDDVEMKLESEESVCVVKRTVRLLAEGTLWAISAAACFACNDAREIRGHLAAISAEIVG